MGDIWEKAIERALCGQKDRACVLSLALDGAVKCVNGRIPVPELLQRFPNLGELSLANVGLSSLEDFPHLPNLRKLNLSDNRIAGSLDFLVKGGLPSLQDLDLSNSKIQKIDDLRPLEPLKLKALDLYESPVTRVKDYRQRVFELIRSLKYLDNMDCQGREKQSDDEDDFDDDDDDDVDDESDEVEEDYDPGSGEIIGNRRNGDAGELGSEGIIGIDDDDDDEDDDEDDSDADEEVELIKLNDSNHQVNGCPAAVSVPNEEDGTECDDEEDDDVVDDDEDEDEGDNEDSSESDEEEVDDDDCEHHQEVDVHEIIASDEDVVETVDLEDVVETVDLGDGVDHKRLPVQNHEIDGHDEGEEDVEDDNGETGEDFFEDGDEEEDYHGGSFLVKAVDEELDGDDVEDDGDAGDAAQFPPSSSVRKRSHDCADGEEDANVRVKKMK